jgi:hypothetical protein
MACAEEATGFVVVERRAKKVGAILLAAASGVLFAQKPGSIEGLVTNSVTGGPVKKAAISARNTTKPFQYSVTADSSGHFRFDNVEPGSYVLIATCSGFAFPNGVRQQPSIVAEDGHVRDVELKLDPFGRISGKVVDEDGDPVEGAVIHAMLLFYDAQGRRFNPSGASQTNDLGEYQIEGAAPGRYYIVVTPPANLGQLPPHTRSSRLDEVFPTTYYPNAPDIAGATALQVRVGTDLASIDVRLHKTRGYSIRGRVAGIQDQPGARSWRLTWKESSVVGMVRGVAVQENDSFEVRGVTAGVYTLRVQNVSGERPTGSETVTIKDHDLENVVLTLTPAAQLSLRGTIRREGSNDAVKNC